VKLVHQHAFAAAGVEHVRAAGQRAKIPANSIELFQIRRVELPIRGQLAVVVTALGVFTRPRDG